MLMAGVLALAGAAQAEVKDAIVKIYTVHSRPDYWNPWSMRGPQQSSGSGCVIQGRKILSNAHVVSDQTFVQVRRNGEAKRWQAKVLEVSHDADLALLTVEDPAFFAGLPELPLGDLPAPQEEVLVYGFPMGGDTLSTTKGVMSRLEHQVYSHSSCYLFAGQLDAAINPGNSGGPVMRDGRIVGVVMQGMTQADNIGYMVPVNIIRHFFDDLKDGRHDGFPQHGRDPAGPGESRPEAEVPGAGPGGGRAGDPGAAALAQRRRAAAGRCAHRAGRACGGGGRHGGVPPA
jgi:S1-C subfamily serine protease